MPNQLLKQSQFRLSEEIKLSILSHIESVPCHFHLKMETEPALKTMYIKMKTFSEPLNRLTYQSHSKILEVLGSDIVRRTSCPH
jgi:hypothetical protein